MPSDAPTSSSSLTAAGLHGADAVLLAADEALRSNPAEADAQVLASLVSIQHLLATAPPPPSLAGKSSGSGSGGGAGTSSSASVLNSMTKGVESVTSSVTKGVGTVTKGVGSAASVTFKAAGTAVAFASRSIHLAKPGSFSKHATHDDPSAHADEAVSHSKGAHSGGHSSSSRPVRRKVPHVVACVSTTSSKAVAAAFFGPPAAAAADAAAAGGFGGGSSGTEWALGAAVGVAGADGSGIVGPRLFTYELLVPGEIEGSVLVQVANEPLYVKVRLCLGVRVPLTGQTVWQQSTQEQKCAYLWLRGCLCMSCWSWGDGGLCAGAGGKQAFVHPGEVVSVGRLECSSSCFCRQQQQYSVCGVSMRRLWVLAQVVPHKAL